MTGPPAQLRSSQTIGVQVIEGRAVEHSDRPAIEIDVVRLGDTGSIGLFQQFHGRAAARFLDREALIFTTALNDR